MLVKAVEEILGTHRMACRLRARHRLREDERPVGRASDAEITALLRACLSARDKLIVLLVGSCRAAPRRDVRAAPPHAASAG